MSRLRRPRRLAAAVMLAGAALAGLAGAAPRTYALPEDPELSWPEDPAAELVQVHCAACHSLDYIVRQPPGMPLAFWEANVAKMVRAYGAEISPTEQKAIADYLARIRAGDAAPAAADAAGRQPGGR